MLTKWRSLVVTGVMLSALVLLGAATAQAQVPDASPGAPTLTVVSHSQVLVGWTYSPGSIAATSFQVGYSAQRTASDFVGITPTTQAVSGGPTASQAVVSGLTAGTRYIFAVRAVNAAGAGDWSTVTEETEMQYGTERKAPVPGVILGRDIGVTEGDEELTLEWREPAANDADAASDLTIVEYLVEWAENIDGTGRRRWAYPVTDRVVTLDRLVNGTMYYVAVGSKNSAGGTTEPSFAASTRASGTPMAPEVPPPAELAAPTDVIADASDGMIAVSWNAVEGADSYEVSWMRVGGTSTTTAMAMGTSHPIEDVTNGTTYSVWVSAMMGDMKGPASAAVTATPMADPLDAPMNVMVDEGDGMLMVSWDAVERADSYIVTWEAEGSGVTSTATAMGTSHPIENLMNGTTYVVWVDAKMGDMYSPPSETVTGTPMAAVVELEAPMNVMADEGDGMLMVSWDAVERADSYKVSWTGGGVTASATAMGTSHPIENLMNGTEYSVTVSAMMGDMEGPASTAVMATPMPAEPVPALPLFGMLALGAGLVAAGRRRLHAQRLLKN